MGFCKRLSLLQLWSSAQDLHKFQPMTSVTIPTGTINLVQCVKDKKERTLRGEGDVHRVFRDHENKE